MKSLRIRVMFMAVLLALVAGTTFFATNGFTLNEPVFAAADGDKGPCCH